MPIIQAAAEAASAVLAPVLITLVVSYFSIVVGELVPKRLALADAEVAEVVIKEGSKLCSKDIKDFDIPSEITLAGLVRDGVGMLVKGNTRLQPGDHVVVFCMHGSFHKVEKFFKK